MHQPTPTWQPCTTLHDGLQCTARVCGDACACLLLPPPTRRLEDQAEGQKQQQDHAHQRHVAVKQNQAVSLQQRSGEPTL